MFTTTLTRMDLAELIVENTSIKKIDMARQAVDTIIDIHKSALFARKAVNFVRCGRIAVYLKAPRIGRNPKTKEEHLITTRHSATFSNKKSVGQGKMNQTALRVALFKKGYTSVDAIALATLWYDFIRNILDGNTRIELRGLGVFYPRVIKAGSPARNPKTGESLFTKDKVIPAFRCSPTLRKAIDAQYL